MALSTRIMRTRAALGTEALATLAAVEVSLERSRVSSEQIKTYTGETILKIGNWEHFQNLVSSLREN